MDFVDEDYFAWKKLRMKGRTRTYGQRENVLELKLRTGRQGKCVGAAKEAYNELFTVIEDEPQDPQSSTIITRDIWLHLANYIAPEDVKNYSLICTESANSVNSRSFWLQMYSSYCQQVTGRSQKWVLCLPEKLQKYNLRNFDRNILRQKVIQALYRCYPPFQMRLQTSYPLEALTGRIYISSWRKLINSKQLMCYKFQFKLPSSTANKKSEASEILVDKQISPSQNCADNWEYLADETNYNSCKENHTYSTSSANSVEGVFILYIYSKRFSPEPIICNNETGLLRFVAGRVLLSNDMKTEDLELKFSTIDEQIVTVKYLKVHEFKVLPWWHPLFEKFLSCE